MDETLDNKKEKLKNAMQYKFIQKCYDLEQKTKNKTILMIQIGSMKEKIY